MSKHNASRGIFPVGIVLERKESGNLLVCHCSSGMNNVVVTEFATSGFTAVGRQTLVPG